MDAATAGVISEAVKILGPAIIAAVATYKVSRAQFEIKLRELDKAHEFRARELLFLHGKERRGEVAKYNEELNKTLGMLLAEATDNIGRPGEERSLFFSGLADLWQYHSKDAPAQVLATLREMERRGLQDSDDYSKLKLCTDRIAAIDLTSTPERAKDGILTLVDVYAALHDCNQALIWKEMEDLLARYTRSD